MSRAGPSSGGRADERMNARPAHRSDDRGQIYVDFLVGIVLFLVAMTFVLGFLPHLLAPYDDQATPVVADRAAAGLGDALLVGDEDPGVLDVDCVDAFFLDGTADCGFDASDSVADRVGVDGTYRVNVSLTWNVTGDADPEVLCFNGGDVGACGTDPLTAGPPVPDDHRAVAIERRTVAVDGRPATLEVRVW